MLDEVVGYGVTARGEVGEEWMGWSWDDGGKRWVLSEKFEE